MKKVLPGYYKLNEAEIGELWGNSKIIFDTNVLLGFYSTRYEYQNKIFETLEKIRDRIWIPYQVASEYEKNTVKAIKEQLGNYGRLQDIPLTLKNRFKKSISAFENHPSAKFHEINAIFDELHKEFTGKTKELFSDLNKERKKYAELEKHDTVRDSIESLLGNNIGKAYKFKEIFSIVEEGKLRYESMIPPGYQDLYVNKKTGVNAYGDLILWYQILDFISEEKKNLIFVTNDEKEDWWNLDKNGQIVSPRKELINEVYSFCGVNSYIYTFDQFFQELNIRILKKQPEEFEKELQELKNIRTMQNKKEYKLYNVNDLFERFKESKSKEQLDYNESFLKDYYLKTKQIRDQFNHYFITSEIDIWHDSLNQLCFSIFKRVNDSECMYAADIIIQFFEDGSTDHTVQLAGQHWLNTSGDIEESFEGIVHYIYEQYAI